MASAPDAAGTAEQAAGHPATEPGASAPYLPAGSYCQRCGRQMQPGDRYCRNCGLDSTTPAWSAAQPVVPLNASDRKRGVATILCLVLGVFGAHRFYAGKVGTGFLWLFTLGFLGIGMLFDLILIVAGEFKDAEGRKIVEW